jgi:hypothetical protein
MKFCSQYQVETFFLHWKIIRYQMIYCFLIKINYKILNAGKFALIRATTGANFFRKSLQITNIYTWEQISWEIFIRDNIDKFNPNCGHYDIEIKLFEWYSKFRDPFCWNFGRFSCELLPFTHGRYSALHWQRRTKFQS